MFSQVSARARLKLKTSEPNTWLKISSSTSPTSISPSSGPTNSKTARNLRLLSDILDSVLRRKRGNVFYITASQHTFCNAGGAASVDELKHILLQWVLLQIYQPIPFDWLIWNTWAPWPPFKCCEKHGMNSQIAI